VKITKPYGSKPELKGDLEKRKTRRENLSTRKSLLKKQGADTTKILQGGSVHSTPTNPHIYFLLYEYERPQIADFCLFVQQTT